MDVCLAQLDFPMAWETFLRLGGAAIAGALLGFEREKHDKPAGLRTHMLVALGAATFMAMVGDYLTGLPVEPALRLDPSRVLAGIVGGVGFLGGGTIIVARGNVHGITTAANIWLAAAVGAACGMGMYALSFTAVVLALGILWGVGRLEMHFFDKEPFDPPDDSVDGNHG
ncbi:MgtC/SapB family protein [Lignipirellula cremea]|uniref:Putative Mg(2+) transport ATPase n=1 Tax=Lignipirellula cremea TaxID=2528010 RepID=A0A518DS01_9BACT|nr:MgtC/SapB family protein [Lignipirellula cremea]QDU94611.1 putative Mg(2+) transport ATPase [Lignipirellula cremea]